MTTNKNIIWHDIPGFEGRYQASNIGGMIRSLDRVIIYNDIKFAGKQRRVRYKGKMLTPRFDKVAGYYRVRIRKTDGPAGGEMFLVHRLVALAHCNKPDGCDYVNHLDGKKLNCNADNLEWTTSSNNQMHALQTGLKRLDVHRKLTLEDVKEIRSARKYYGYIDELAKRFNVAKVTISLIRSRKNWKYA